MMVLGCAFIGMGVAQRHRHDGYAPFTIAGGALVFALWLVRLIRIPAETDKGTSSTRAD
jgi:hypothetical protein